jgi:hypothetical protein
MKRVVAFVALAALSLIGPGALAASAHGADESNYKSVVTSITPSTTAFTVRTIELGSRLELTVARGHSVLVKGYDGEPYLRIGDDGVYENFHSPSHWVNRDRYGRVALPPEANSDLPPEWVRVADQPFVGTTIALIGWRSCSHRSCSPRRVSATSSSPPGRCRSCSTGSPPRSPAN